MLTGGDILVIAVKRIYDLPAPEDGYRILVERLWPRGISKERAKLNLWLPDAGASTSLRKWYGHDPTKWDTFRLRYFAELRDSPGVIQQLRGILGKEEHVTFLYSTRHEQYNNAVALKEFLEQPH